MRRILTTTVVNGEWISVFSALMAILLVGPETCRPAFAQTPKESDYVGFTKCAACHFPQYKEWQLSEHGKAFDILPTKYKDDAECLQCHSTPVGKNAMPATVSGVSCEACHGPGGEHSRFALRFVNELITDESLKTLRSKIHRIDANRCVKCHITKAHKPHPKFDRDVRARGRPSGRQTRATSALFNFSKVHSDKSDAY